MDLYTVKLDGTLRFLASSSLRDADGVSNTIRLTFNNDTAVLVATGTHLAMYGINGSTVGTIALSTGPVDSGTLDLAIVVAATAFVVAGDPIVPMPPGGGTNDHLSVYDLRGGSLGTPGQVDAGRGPGRVLALGSFTQIGPPIPPNPLVYVTNSRDNNVVLCIPSSAPHCPTVAIVSTDMDPHGITGFLGVPGN